MYTQRKQQAIEDILRSFRTLEPIGHLAFFACLRARLIKHDIHKLESLAEGAMKHTGHNPC